MKKLKTIFACLIMLCSCVIFASCTVKVESISFENTSIVLEIGDTYNLNPIISPSKASEEVVSYSSSDSRIVVISPENVLTAISEGFVQIEAEVGGKKAYLNIEVVEQKIKLHSPVGLQYDCSENKIIWEPIANANSYDVEINGEVVLEKTPNTFYQLSQSSETNSIRVKANGTGKYTDSEFTQAYIFANVATPTNVSFDKLTKILSWEYEGSASFKVCIGKQLTEPIDEKFYYLGEAVDNVGSYEISVVAIADGEVEGVNLFDSLKSQSLTITKLAKVDKNSIKWNSTQNLLTWGVVENAQYKIDIDGDQYLSDTNSIILDDLNKGIHEITITAVSNNANVIESEQSEAVNVTITKQLPTPEIIEYDAVAQKLSAKNFGDALDFYVRVDGLACFNGAAEIVGDIAYFNISSNNFSKAGTHVVTVQAKDDSARFYTQSNVSEKYEILKLDKPTGFRIDNGTTISFATIPQAEYGYQTYICGETYTQDDTEYYAFDLLPGSYDFRAKYLGNNKNVLESDFATFTIKKLSNPSLDFDKANQKLTISAEVGHKFNISVNSAMQKNIETNPYYLSGLLKYGENEITVQTISNENEIISNIVDMTVYKLEELEEVSHYTANNVSYIKFKTNSNYNKFYVTKNSEQNLEFNSSVDGEYTILQLTKSTSEIFNTDGLTTLTVQAGSSNSDYISTAIQSVEINKLSAPSGLTFAFPNSFSWNKSDDLEYSFEFVIYKDGVGIHNNITTEDSETISGLALGNLEATIRLLGNNTNVLNSNFCQAIICDHNKLQTPQNIQFANDTITWNAVNGANKYEILVGGTKYYSDTNSFDTKEWIANKYDVMVKAQNTIDSTLDSDYSSSTSISISRKLLAPTNLVYNKSTNKLTFDEVDLSTNNAIALATKYMVYIDGVQASPESSSSTEFTFNSDAFIVAGTYQITVKAFADGVYIQESDASNVLTLTKLSAPTAININDEIVSCTFNPDVIDHTEILINDVQNDNLSGISGDINVKAKFIGISDNYIDSEYFDTTIYRLGNVSGFKLEDDIIVWNAVANASGYSLLIKPENENPVRYFVDTTSYNYAFSYQGSYTIEINAVGDTIETTEGGQLVYKTYLNSGIETLQVKKNVAPEIVSFSEDVSARLITIELQYDGDVDSVSKFSVYKVFNGVAYNIGETTTLTFECSSSLFLNVGTYSVYVIAVGNNDNNYVSSIASNVFQTYRLTTPDIYVFGTSYIIQTTNISFGTTYKVIVDHVYDGVTTNIKEEIIPISSNVYNVCSFAEEMASDQFKNALGQISISVVSLGNNTTLLRSVITNYSLAITPLPTLSNDADNLIINRTNENCGISLSYYVNGQADEITYVYYGYQYIDNFEIPNTWSDGVYTFMVRQYFDGIVSPIVTYSITRLPCVSNYTLTRDDSNKNIVTINWEEVENANGYILYYALDQYQTNITELYRGTNNYFTLPIDELPEKILFFFFKVLGGSGTYVSSTCGWVGWSVIKLHEDEVNLRNSDGVLTWSEYGQSQFCSNYLLVVTDDNGTDEILLSNDTYSYSLQGYSGQLNIKLKQLGNFSSHGLDSSYATLEIIKLPTPTNVSVREGQIIFDHEFIQESGKDITYVYVIDGQEYPATEDGIASLTETLLSGVSYQARVKAYNTSYYLTSDLSSPIIVQVLANPNTDDGSTYISTNTEKTVSYLNWNSIAGTLKYEIRVIGDNIEQQSYIVSENSWQISGYAEGNYCVNVRRIGQTGPDINSICYLSSSFSKQVCFRVLEAPAVSIVDGLITWTTQSGANNYYIYSGDGYKVSGNTNLYTFVGEYYDQTSATEFSIQIQAIGDGVNYLASAKSVTMSLVKPRSPQMLTVIDGALTWADKDGYTYYTDTTNNRIYLEFIQNGVVYESFEIDSSLVNTSWPHDNDYLQSITNNLPSGEYTLRIKQIGDSTKVITSEYNEQSIDVIVAPTPTNVFVDDNKLQWNAVVLDDYNEGNVIEYIVYAFDADVNDWIKLTETTNTFINVENTDGLLLTRYTKLAVATKGNDSGSTYKNYITGNMSNVIEIIVLGSTNDLQTTDGNFVWGTVANTVQYRIESENNNMVLNGNIQSSYLGGFVAGVHNIRVRALGNGSSLNGTCIINGIYGQSKKFTKLATPTISSETTSENTLEWGLMRWDAISNANGYNVYLNYNVDVNSEIYTHTYEVLYKSDVLNTYSNKYNVQTKGNTAIPSEYNIAYISSDFSNTLTRSRLAQVVGVEVIDGVLYWDQSNSAFANRYYIVEFYKDGIIFKKDFVEEVANNLQNINGLTKIKYDVAGIVTDGSYDVYIKEVQNSAVYIAGIESEMLSISKLRAPENVRLENGILTWNDVVDATNFIVKLVNASNVVTEYTEGFSFDGTNWSWTSPFENIEVFTVSVRAISEQSNKLSSSWSNKYGEITDGSTPWVVYQIPKIQLNRITVNEDGTVVWSYASSAGIPTNRAYMVWRKGELSYETTILTSAEYVVDSGLSGIQVRTIPYGENSYYYFASVFSEVKDIEKPAAPTNLSFDKTTQIFTWDAAGTSDATYIVHYTIDGGAEQILETSTNKFEPTILGQYVVTVQTQKSKTTIGTSLECEPVSGNFDLFTSGAGTSANPFIVTNSNFENIIYRKSAYFKLSENITRINQTPLGVSGSSISAFGGNLDGNNKTITLSFSDVTFGVTYIGLFAEIGSGAVVKNLNIVINGDFDLSSCTSGQVHAGVLAGNVTGGALIDNCSVSGAITIYRSADAETRFGGLVGILTKGTIKDSSSSLNITCETSHISKVGGIVGMVGVDSTKLISTDATVNNCSNSGTITGANVIGGIAAQNLGTITNCTNNGALNAYAFNDESISATNDAVVGGIVGNNQYAYDSTTALAGGNITNSTNYGTIKAYNQTGNEDVNSYVGGIAGVTKNGTINNNTNRGNVLLDANNDSKSKAAQAIIGYFEAYTVASENFKLAGHSQVVPSGIEMTITNVV